MRLSRRQFMIKLPLLFLKAKKRLRMQSDILSIGMLLFAISGLYGCKSALPNIEERSGYAIELAEKVGWKVIDIPHKEFDLRAFVSPEAQMQMKVIQWQSQEKEANADTPQPNTKKILSVYIEGDGHAWDTTSIPSKNPTPIHPIALKLGLRQGQGLAIVLARPCQYIGVGTNQLCQTPLWTSHRFDNKVVDLMNQAITQMKRKTGARNIRLIGYSGGAAIALMVASQRDDMQSILTVAGNLDPSAWARFHGLSPLADLPNIDQIVHRTAGIAQIDFVGEDVYGLRAGKDVTVNNDYSL